LWQKKDTVYIRYRKFQTILSGFGNAMLNVQDHTADFGNAMLNVQGHTSNFGNAMLNVQGRTSNFGNAMLNVQGYTSNFGNAILKLQDHTSYFGRVIKINFCPIANICNATVKIVYGIAYIRNKGYHSLKIYASKIIIKK
jgi:hypothetical protein